MKLSIVLLIGACSMWGQEMVGKSAPISITTPLVVTVPSRFEVYKDSGLIAYCDFEQEIPHNCTLQSGHTLDELMQAWMSSSKQQNESWKAENADTEKRLCIALEMLKAITHSKAKLSGCVGKLESKEGR